MAYTRQRKQFGKPIASIQLIQNHLVEMLSNLTAMQTMVFRLSQVSRAREVMGGNGILLQFAVFIYKTRDGSGT